MQGNLHLGKYSNFISIKILLNTLTEHCSFKPVYILQFMLGKLFAIGEEPMKAMCVRAFVCVFVWACMRTCFCVCMCACVCVCVRT
jgi:hypothetical protein